MQRSTAVEKLARVDLQWLSLEERRELLEVMRLEDWSKDPRWSALPLDVQEEFRAELLVEAVDSTRYDAVLLLWLTQRYAAATRAFLLARLQSEFGTAPGTLTGGGPRALEACPCCGRKAIGERGNYEICRVCWWEDDGQDNAEADARLGGPNGGLSLTEGRLNFLLHGIADPARDDLRKHQDPPEMYEVGRRFELLDDGASVRESTSESGLPKKA